MNKNCLLDEQNMEANSKATTDTSYLESRIIAQTGYTVGKVLVILCESFTIK